MGGGVGSVWSHLLWADLFRKRVDVAKLPKVDYKHLAYSKWNICMNLTELRVPEQHLDAILMRREGSVERDEGEGVKSYSTLLYKIRR